MLASLIIVFREVIEAGLIVGIVLAATRSVPQRGWWVAAGALGGVLGACVVAAFASQLGGLFNGSGQELFNATILLIAVGMLTWHNTWMASHGRELAREVRAVGSAVASGERPLTALAIVVGIAISASVAWFTADHANPALPDAFGGLHRIHDEDLDRALATFSNAVDGYGFEGDIAVYGPGIPSVALAWISGGTDAPVEDFDVFASGFASTSGGDTLDTDHLLDRTTGGTRYRCAPIVGSLPATLCVWQDGEVYWALYDLRGSNTAAAFALARSARTATS